MSSILLSNEIVIYLFVQIVLFVLLFIAFYFSISIIKNWDYEKTSTKQYKLEKTSYLVILIISFTLIVKIFLFPYFTYSLDNLSNIVPGAMCAAGIVGAISASVLNLGISFKFQHWPGASVMFVRSVFAQEVPVADAYCTDQPLRLTEFVPLLNNSIKSCV